MSASQTRHEGQSTFINVINSLTRPQSSLERRVEYLGGKREHDPLCVPEEFHPDSVEFPASIQRATGDESDK